ncbi:MAG TPA: hypothetical protein VGS19_37660 [Streptosporangiaceae bacterium]|nr:hypothetical protein [Streptosporangiaceae bacterium]
MAIEDWLARGGYELDEEEPRFPESDGPVFLLGDCALVDAMWALVGEDPLRDVMGVLVPALDQAVPSVGGQDIADALVCAFATHYRCEQPARRANAASDNLV